MSQVVVIDLGTGNLRSVGKAVEHVPPSNSRVRITRDPAAINAADRLVLPGQGAIGSWLAALDDEELKYALLKALDSKPVLAICVGMQALYEFNYEDGGHSCLGRLKGEVVRFEDGNIDQQGLPMKVPQMGWNKGWRIRPHPVWKGIDDGSWFYFVHSYYACNTEPDAVTGETEYGVRYCSAAAVDNIFAIQCHPEKSHATGLKLIENFINWNC